MDAGECGKLSRMCDRPFWGNGEKGDRNSLVCPEIRRGFKSPSHSASRLKTDWGDMAMVVENCVFQFSFRGLLL
ncbi:hypothetical protein QUB63_12780 [Microcoleus sp. ARI1-B5]|uniref:hypothetical protein n=1 Tax=unclassified Microcoleus TaxID=2642155 RepID=UPI002FD0A6FF